MVSLLLALLRSSAGAAVEDRFREYKWHARSSSRTQLTPLLLAHKNGPALKLSHLTNSETPSPTTFYPIAPTKTPSFSPTGFPTLSPTANRLNMTMDRLTNVSGAEGFRNLTSPQYRAALHVADQDELIVSRGPPQTVAALFVDRVLFRHERRQLIVQQKQYTWFRQGSKERGKSPLAGPSCRRSWQNTVNKYNAATVWGGPRETISSS